MTDYGVTPAGFVVKPFIEILNAKLDRARALFGPDVDLRSTSALRKTLDAASAEDQEHWKALEGAYYANFISTATAEALNRLGEDLGLGRGLSKAGGQVSFTLTPAAAPIPGQPRVYALPVGVLLETADGRHFRTMEAARLSATQPNASVAAEAVLPGPDGDIAASAIVAINPVYAAHYLWLGGATVAATNPAPFTGGDQAIDDETYRAQLLRLPRNIFTLDAVRGAVSNVDGVRACKIADSAGGVDVSLSIFNSFVFDRRRFGQARQLGTPYFFDVLVAPLPGYAWETIGGVPGLQDLVSQAVEAVRPIGIFPNIRIANSVEVGVRASVSTSPGMNALATDAALRQAFENRLSGLAFGDAVLASEVLYDFMNVPGVVDVQNLHLRRYPPTFGSIVFGDRETFQFLVIEADLGANLALAANEIASFRYDSQLIDLQIGDR